MAKPDVNDPMRAGCLARNSRFDRAIHSEPYRSVRDRKLGIFQLHTTLFKNIIFRVLNYSSVGKLIALDTVPSIKYNK